MHLHSGQMPKFNLPASLKGYVRAQQDVIIHGCWLSVLFIIASEKNKTKQDTATGHTPGINVLN